METNFRANIEANFAHKTLTPILGKPTPKTVQRLIQELYANACAIPSLRGGGNHGHLILLMADVDYENLTATPFAVPDNPGQLPVPANFATSAQINAINALHSQQTNDFNVYIATKNALRSSILAAVSEDYYNILRDPIFGYASVTPLALLTHIKTHYGQVTSKDLEQNRESLRAPWNPDDEIASLWTRNLNCQDFARNSTEPITESTSMLLLLDAIGASGVMTQYISEWKRRDEADQTYDNFMAHFTRANKVRIEETTTKQAGYHQAHATTAPPPRPTQTGNITTGQNTTTPATTIRADNLVQLFYCWTHGLGRNPRHTSHTCKNPGQGHQTDATIMNVKGGSNTFQTEASVRRTFTRKDE